MFDSIVKKFGIWLKGKSQKFTKKEIGYIKHALQKSGGQTSGHPLFVLMQVVHGHGEEIERFLIETKNNS